MHMKLYYEAYASWQLMPADTIGVQDRLGM
jgi:hypothetical protein